VLANTGFEVSAATVDVSSRESVHGLIKSALAHGDVTRVIHAAGVSPSQAEAQVILAVDLYGTAVVLEEFGNVVAQGGAGVVIASQSGHRLGALTAEEDKALATTPADELLALPMLQPDQVTATLHAYQLAKSGNSLRVMAEAVRWARRGARVNTISPGIIITPLARDELTGPRGEGYRRMIEQAPAGRAGTRTGISAAMHAGARLGQCSGMSPQREPTGYTSSAACGLRDFHQPRSLAEELDERALVPEGIEITVFHSDLAKAGPPLERNA